MRHYEELTQEGRYQIKALREMGFKQAEVARRLGRSSQQIARPHQVVGGVREQAQVIDLLHPTNLDTGASTRFARERA